jgi:Protein of unknown function (DUF1153)
MPETEDELQLPAPNTDRWTLRRKAAVLQAVRNGVLTVEQASNRYALSVEELCAWERDFDQHGLPGLRSTRLQVYRRDERLHAPIRRPTIQSMQRR